MKIAIMQPYFFPYIGYFQLINSVDHFVFYDDVNFIKGGWINRNRILINHSEAYITIPCEKISSNKLIHDIKLSEDKKNLTKTIELSYRKAPFFNKIFPFLKAFFDKAPKYTLSEFNIFTLQEISSLLGQKTTFHISSKSFPGKNFNRTDRLIFITKALGGDTYINAINGQSLYQKTYFIEKGLNLNFLHPKDFTYKQFQEPFIPWLSIIDVLMFNPIEKVQNALGNYELI